MNVLFTSVGRRVSLIKHFRDSMARLNLKGNIVTTDLQKNAPACFVSDYAEQVPLVTDPTYIDYLHQICRKYEITLLIPLIDTELYLLSMWTESFAAIGVKLLVSSPETNKICIDKRVTYDFFEAHQIPTPKLYTLDEIVAARTR